MTGNSDSILSFLDFEATVAFYRSVCPLIFKDVHLTDLQVGPSLQRNFIRNEMLEFSQLDTNILPIEVLNIYIEMLRFRYMYRLPFESVLD